MGVQELVKLVYAILAGATLVFSITLIGFGVGIIRLEFVAKTTPYLILLILFSLTVIVALAKKTSHHTRVCYNVFLVKDFNAEEAVKELITLAKFLKSLSRHTSALIEYASKPNEPAKLCITLSSQDQLQAINIYIKNNFNQLVFEQHKTLTTAMQQEAHNMRFKGVYLVKLDRKILYTFVCNLVKNLALVGFQNLVVLDWKGYLKNYKSKIHCWSQSNYSIVDMSFTVSVRKKILILKSVVEKQLFPIIIMASDDIESLRLGLSTSQKHMAELAPIIVLCANV